MLTLIALAAALTGGVQDRAEQPRCFPPSVPVEAPKLVQVVADSATTTLYAWAPSRPPHACDPRSGECRQGPVLQPNYPVEVIFADSDWACIAADGRGRLWIEAKKLSPITINPSPALADWVGTWGETDGDRLEITSTDGRTLSMHGEARWFGAMVNGSQVIHSGEVDTHAVPSSNPFRIVESGCEITLTLLGQYLKLTDNEGCGGMNVRFQGYWPKVIPKR